jgi:hypothetical protein
MDNVTTTTAGAAGDRIEVIHDRERCYGWGRSAAVGPILQFRPRTRRISDGNKVRTGEALGGKEPRGRR